MKQTIVFTDVSSPWKVLAECKVMWFAKDWSDKELQQELWDEFFTEATSTGEQQGLMDTVVRWFSTEGS